MSDRPFFRVVLRRVVTAGAILTIAACSSTPSTPSGGHRAALPGGGVYKIGKPYQVAGIWYYPKVDYDYDETGIASWYGPGFHEDATANGEVFDQNSLTGAHKTLPLPTLVRVTNLDNGRSIVVRINDRGPYVANRIIDLSRRSAQLLGFEQAGTAKVRVTVLPDESRAIVAMAMSSPAAQAANRAESGPAPQAAPRAAVQVEGLPPPKATTQRDAVQMPTTVPGETVDGRFLPAPVVVQQAVTGPHQIYVQAGAFTVYDNASRMRSRLSPLGRVNVQTATVAGTQYYRVRLGPINTVEQADSLLNQVLGTGVDTARIIVD
ncbi:MAG: septal ring lytic transglycosylase RlpA family protein [Azospirillaceae bacterium]|nr:septal ring lytic transglycosylase RlpA family protein [Azospirillaceae bacterium]